MDQSHGHGIGSWDPNNSFAGDSWDQQFGAFDQTAGAESSYPNPDFLDGGDINPQLSGADGQGGLYRPFEYFGQGDVWSDHAQATAAPFAQDSSLQQGFFGEQRHPTDGNPAIDGRFALGIQQGNEFPPQLQSNANQQVNPHHSFGHGVANAASSAPNGYHQAPIPQWQEQMPAGYGSGHQFENPLTAAQTSNISAPASNGSPAAFFSGHGASASVVPGYQPEMRQQTPVNSRQSHPQLAASLNGQSQQPVPSQSPARKATPQQQPQQIHQQAPQQVILQHQPTQQPAQRPVQQSVQQNGQQPVQQHAQQHVLQPIRQHVVQPVQPPAQRPALHPAIQAGTGQHVSLQQPLSQPPSAQQPQSSENTVAAGGPQVAQAVAKKAKVSVPAAAANPSPPVTQPQTQNVSDPVSTIDHQDSSLLSTARGRPDARWGGVPNVVVDPAPAKLQKGTPTKRYVTLATKGGKPPLFTRMWRPWTPAESLGNHADAYQKSDNDLDRQRADIRLEIEMQREKSEIPVDWWRKGLKDRLGIAVGCGSNMISHVDCPLTPVAFKPQRPAIPSEPLLSGLKAVEYLRFHPDHLRNQKTARDVCTEFAAFLQAKAAHLKAALQAAADKPKDGEAEAKARTAKEQLERAITEGLRVEPGNLFAGLSGSNKMIAILINVVVKLINADEATSSLVKAILRLYTRLTKVTSDQLERLQMEKLRKGLKKEGDAEAKGLIAQVYENARRNDEDESESESDSPSAESGVCGKKVAPAQARVLSKQSAPGGDQKRTTASSALKSATSTTDSRKLSSAPTSSKAMTSSNETNKAAPKASQKVPSTATGTKRSREEDSVGAEVRSSKKPATDTSSAAKSLATPAGKPATTKPTAATTASASAAAQTKPRSALLLPGKARPAAKPAAKPEPTKAEAQKSATKPESTLKTQPTKTPTVLGGAKTAKPKPAEAAKEAPASPSIFSTLMKQIVEEKKTIKTPATKKVNAPDPNETPEERERRLRKERRRGLRVAFKTGDALVEVREFTRHPEEIAEGNMARNVRIDGRDKNSEESEMMKRLRGGQGIKALEINDREWEEPTAINFTTNIPQEKREKTYVTCGGLKVFETDEQKLTRERESKELMVIYHNRADIPPNPRSPPYEPSLSGNSAVHEAYLSPSTPEYDEMMQRGREFKQWGPYHASRAAQSRLDTKARPDYADFTKTMKSINSIADSYNGQPPRQPEVRPQQAVAQPATKDPRSWYEPTTAARRDQQTLELLSSDKAKYFRDCDRYEEYNPRRMTEEELDNCPKLRKVLDNLQRIADSLKANQPAKPAQATPATQPVPQAAPQVAQPVASQHPGVTAQGDQAATADYTAAWAQYYAAQQQQQQQQAWYGQQQNPYTQAANPYLQAQAPQAAQQQQTADPNSQYASILAALGVQQPAAQPQAQPTADQNSQIQAALMALAAGSQGQAAAPAPADPQNAQYLLDMVNKATAQNQAQGQNQAQAAQAAYQQYYGQAAAQGYGQGYGGQSHQEREAYGQMYGSNNGGQDRERDRDRDGGYGRDRSDRDHHRGNKGRNTGSGSSGGGKNENVPDHLRGINRHLIGTKACAFWAKGQCAKGDKCTFRHD
ncbi:hypothetical protein C8A01DRAFT_44319 [Parachaetomium inaequale]|uniref:C3H1-type domain-containing protein n=1 Tax=Parachaetomium inaequale TaxID=2588326 RepID=A0AAN6PKJ8_9PEZI|nr:hypothetical protein C8A01DRAFT_44319 [Parachaetomium inaequale]